MLLFIQKLSFGTEKLKLKKKVSTYLFELCYCYYFLYTMTFTLVILLRFLGLFKKGHIMFTFSTNHFKCFLIVFHNLYCPNDLQNNNFQKDCWILQ